MNRRHIARHPRDYELPFSAKRACGIGKKWSGETPREYNDSRHTHWQPVIDSCFSMPIEPSAEDFPELLRISEQFKETI